MTYAIINMTNPEVPIFTKIDLIPWAGEKFYVYVIPEGTEGCPLYSVWLFRERYGIATHTYGVSIKDPEAVTMRHIKCLDMDGYFDPMKEELYEMP